MGRVSLYLNFLGTTEAAFAFYREIFGGELVGPQRMGDIPAAPDMPELTEADRDKIMHIELTILGGMVLMGTDVLESMGRELKLGNNVSINLEPDELSEARRLFDALADGATDVMPLQPMFWGAHYGSLCDRFGVRWMVNCAG